MRRLTERARASGLDAGAHYHLSFVGAIRIGEGCLGRRRFGAVSELARWMLADMYQAGEGGPLMRPACAIPPTINPLVKEADAVGRACDAWLGAGDHEQQMVRARVDGQGTVAASGAAAARRRLLAAATVEKWLYAMLQASLPMVVSFLRSLRDGCVPEGE